MLRPNNWLNFVALWYTIVLQKQGFNQGLNPSISSWLVQGYMCSTSSTYSYSTPITSGMDKYSTKQSLNHFPISCAIYYHTFDGWFKHQYYGISGGGGNILASLLLPFSTMNILDWGYANFGKNNDPEICSHVEPALMVELIVSKNNCTQTRFEVSKVLHGIFIWFVNVIFHHLDELKRCKIICCRSLDDVLTFRASCISWRRNHIHC